MHADPRFSVVLATAGHPERQRLLRLLSGRFCVRALRSDAQGTSSAVDVRRPDVLVCDPICGEGVLARAQAGAPPPATWVVVHAEADTARVLPPGITLVAASASDRRLLAAVAAAGRFARAGIQVRARPALPCAAAPGGVPGTAQARLAAPFGAVLPVAAAG